MPYVRPVEHDTPADVAELVDALVSGTSGSNVVGVQVSPSALKAPPLGGELFLLLNPAALARFGVGAQPSSSFCF